MSEPFDARAFVANLPRRPGVYRMYSADGALLYVGKAQRYRVRNDRLGINLALAGHNAIQSTFVFSG